MNNEIKQTNGDFVVMPEKTLEDYMARCLELETLACELRDALKSVQTHIAKNAGEGFIVKASLMELFATNQVSSEALKKAQEIL